MMAADASDSGSAGRSAGGPGQEPTQAVVEDDHGVLAVRAAAADPRVQLGPQVRGPVQLDQAADLDAASQRQQRRIEARRPGEQEGDPAPGLRRMDEARPVGGAAISPAARPAVAPHLHLRRGLATWASDRMASTALRKAASWPVSSAGRRSSTVRLSRRPSAIITPSAISQGAPSSTAAVPCARTSRSGRVDHQRRWSATAQEAPPGDVDRLPGRAALGEARRLDALQSLHGRHRLGTVETRQRAGEGLRRRRSARQAGGPCVEPCRKLLDLAHGSALLPSGASAMS